MSKTVDERVVEMRFDNKDFESNVKTSMNTLERLKASMKFDKAAESLKDIDKAARSVSFESMATSVSNLENRFSILGIAGKRAIENITDSVMNFGKKTWSFLTSGITSGGLTRAMNLENAHFQLQGLLKDEQAVAAVMEDVNYAVDGTAYSLDAAAKVASQLAASGMRAGDAMKHSLRGVAGVAAMTNSSYEDIGRIFTQVAGQGRLMGQDLLQLSSRGMNAAATIADYLHITESEVRDMVSKGQISFEIFSNAMDEAFGEHAKKANETFTGAMSNIKASLARIGAEFISPLIVQNGPLVQLLNTIRERINEVKASIGPLAEIFTGFINESLTGLNKVLQKMDWSKPFEKFKGLNSKWDEFIGKVNEAGVSTDDFQSKLSEVASKHGMNLDKMIEKEGSLNKVMESGKISKKMIIETLREMAGAQEEAAKSTVDYTDKLEYFQDVVHKVWQGDYSNGEERIKALTDAGYDYAQVQDLVNKTIDDHTVSLEDLTDAQLENIGYTEDEITAIRKLAQEAEKAGTPLNELISSLQRPSGKQLMLEALHNILRAIVDPLRAFGRAWKEIFIPQSSEELYNSVAAFKAFTDTLVMSDDTMDKLTRTFKGLFAAIDLITSITGGALKFAFKVLCEVLGVANVDILTMTAYVGDAIVKFREWVNEHSLLSKIVSGAVKGMAKFIKLIVQFVEYLYQLPAVQNGLNRIADGFRKISDSISGYFGEGLKRVSEFIQRCKDLDGLSLENVLAAFRDFKQNVIGYFFDLDGVFDKVPDGLISGLVNGLKAGISKVGEVVLEIGKTIITTICDFLGIHSPATKAIEIGKNIIDGLVIGIKSGFDAVLDAMGYLGSLILSSLEKMNIDFNKIVVVGALFGGMVIAKDFIKVLDKLLTPVNGINNILNALSGTINKLGTSIAKNIDARTWQVKSEVILNMAKAIAILAASMWLLSKIRWQDLIKAGVALGALAGFLLLLAKASSKVDDVKGFGKLSVMMLSLGASLLIMSSAVKKIAKLDPTDSQRAVVSILALMTGMGLIMKMMATIVKTDNGVAIQKAGVMFLEMAAALGVMAVVIRMLAGLSDSQIEQGIGLMILIEGLFAAMVAVSKFAGENAAKAGIMFMQMSVAIGILAIVIRMLGSLSTEQITKGLTVIGYVGIVFAAMMALSKFAGKNAAKAGAMFMQMGVAIGMLAVALRILGDLSMKQINRGLTVINYMSILFVAFVAMSKFAGKHAAQAGKMIMQMGVAIGMLAVAIKLLANISMADIVKGYGVIAAISALFAALVAVSKFAGEHADKAGKMLLQMSISIFILAAAIAVLSFLDAKDIAKATIAVDSLLGMYALVLKASGKMSDSKGAFKNIIAMTVMMGVLAASLIVLSQLDPANVAVATACLSALMGMFAVLMRVSKYATGSLKTLAGITLVIGTLAGVLYLLAKLPVERSIGAAASLSILMVSLAAALRIMSTVKSVSKNALTAMYALSGVVAVLALILGVMATLDVNPSLETATALSVLLISLSIVTAILSAIGPAAPYALLGALALDGVIIILGALVVGIGALFKKVSGLESFFDKGIEIMVKLFRGLGEMIGAIAGGIGEGLSDSLPAIADNLSSFMDKLGPFLDGASKITPEMGSSIRNLCAALLELTGAAFLDGIARFITGDNSIPKFAAQLVPFGDALGKFAESVKGLDCDAIKNAAAAAKALTELDPNNSGGIVSWFTGDNTLDDFGKQLVKLGKGLKSFSKSVTGINTEDIYNAVDALNALTKVKPKNDGGVVSWFTGDDKLDNFGKQLSSLGGSLKTFGGSVKGLNADDIYNAVDVLNALTKIKPKNDGGIKSWFEGDDKLDNFGKQLSGLGEGLKSFGSSVAELNVEAMDGSVKAAEKIAKLTKTLGDIDDVTVLGDFSGQLKKLAKAMGDFCDKVADIDSESLATVISQANKLAKFIESLDSFSGDGVSSFVTALSTLGTASVDGFISAFTNAYGRAQAAGTGLVNALKSGMSLGMAAVSVMFVGVIANCLTIINGRYGAFMAAGVRLMSGFVTGLRAGSVGISVTLLSMIVSCTTALRSGYGSFYSAGMYVASGFANGISANSYLAVAQAAAMAEAAAEAARKKLKVNSPSKVFRDIGKGIPEGMALGVNLLKGLVLDSVKTMAVDVIDSANTVANKLATTDFDARPTITPVVNTDDLRVSDLDFTANIDFSINRSMAMLSEAMYGSQSEIIASNREVVESINNLRSDIVGGVKQAIREVFDEVESEPIVVENHVGIDGKELANATATYIQRATNKLTTRANRKNGIV